MFWGKSEKQTYQERFIERLIDEADYLRSKVNELEKALIAISNSGAYWDMQLSKDAPKEPTAVDPMGQLNSMKAETPQEIEDKKMAMSQINSMFTGSTIIK